MRTANMLGSVMLLAIAVITGSVALCPNGYHDLDVGCYHFWLETVQSWEEAFAVCQLVMNGYLVEIESQEEQDLLVGYINAVADPQGKYAYWMGATDKAVPGQFRWMTSGHFMTFTAWRPSDPNNYYGNEECVAFESYGDYLWSDFKCAGDPDWAADVQRAICETAQIE